MFTNSNILVQDDSGDTFSYLTNQSGPLVVTPPLLASGTWKWVVYKPGFLPAIGSFAAVGLVGSLINPTLIELKQPNGDLMYTGAATPNTDVNFDLTPANERVLIGIDNATVSAQEVTDATLLALSLEEGLEFLIATAGSLLQFISTLLHDYILMGPGYQFLRQAAQDIDAFVEAIPISQAGDYLDEVNGAIGFLEPGGSCPSETEIANAVWNRDLSEHGILGSSGKTVKDTLEDITTMWSEMQVMDTNLQTTLTNVQAIQTNIASIQAELDKTLKTAQATLGLSAKTC